MSQLGYLSHHAMDGLIDDIGAERLDVTAEKLYAIPYVDNPCLAFVHIQMEFVMEELRCLVSERNQPSTLPAATGCPLI